MRSSATRTPIDTTHELTFTLRRRNFYRHGIDIRTVCNPAEDEHIFPRPAPHVVHGHPVRPERRAVCELEDHVPDVDDDLRGDDGPENPLPATVLRETEQRQRDGEACEGDGRDPHHLLHKVQLHDLHDIPRCDIVAEVAPAEDRRPDREEEDDGAKDLVKVLSDLSK